MASCTICGRQCESNEDGLVLLGTCPCVKAPLGSFLRYAVDTCVNPLPSLEVVDGRLVDFEEDFDA